MKSGIIEVSGLSKHFQGKEVVKNLSFSVQEGTITGLLGPNGSGKTTIIRLLNGVIAPTAGELKVIGQNPLTGGDEIRKQTGIVTETTSLYQEMTAWDNLMFFSSIYGMNDSRRAEELLKAFGMWKHKDSAVGTFSTGMKKRVSLAKALLQRPKILFLDEPTNGLDPEGIHLVLHYLNETCKKEGVTVIICSHVLQQLEGICDAYMFIKNGKLIESGTKEEIEKRHLKNVQVDIETGLSADGATFAGHPFQIIGPHTMRFELSGKEDISPLLISMLERTWVHSCTITNNTLEDYYFAIGSETDESGNH